ncbi:MAG TPA: hypothetical protein DEO59_02125 [Balneola sp.]|nr:hypothetical protein [Balneola sp.]
MLAQSISSIDFENLKSDELSDAQITQIYRQAQEQGLSIDELSSLAIARGMSPTEVAKLRSRFNSIPDNKNSSIAEITATQNRLRTNEDDTKISKVNTVSVSDTEKKIFGSDLFTSKNLSFEPSQNVPTPKNYVLGAGDQVIIDVYGAAEDNYILTVSPEGSIQIRNIGPIPLSGLTIEEASIRIKTRLSSIYSGLKGNNPDTFVQVTLGSIRSIKVHIIGEVKLPGTFNVSSLSTVFNALYVAGGPSKNGTYRAIKVIRSNNVITEIDLYDFLVNGTTQNNVVLQDQDIVKIDLYLNRVSVNGETKRVGLFETKPGETFSDLLTYAGGFNQQAYTKKIKIRRNTDSQKSIVEIDFPEESGTILKSGDEISIGKILDRYDNRVEIQGAVYREGEYQLEENPTLLTLLENVDGLLGDAYLNRAIIYRTNPNYTVRAIPVNLNEIFEDPENKDIKLVKDDIIRISSIFDLRQEQTINISGEVIKGGTFPFVEDMTLKDLIFQAKGFTDAAANYNIEIARRILDDGSGEVRNELAEIFQINVREGLILSVSNPEFRLRPHDQVFVRSSPTYESQKNVSVKGQVVYPGTYTLKNRGYRISDLVKSSGGTTEFAYPKGAQLNRPSINDSTSIVAIELEKILRSPGSDIDLLLQPGDVLNIPKKLETVLVDGHVFAPSNIRFNESKSFKDYINSAGGATDSANTKKSYIKYANGEVDRVKRFLFFRNYPNVEPGSKIIVPRKPIESKISTSERIAILSTIVSMAAIVTSTIFQIRSN